MNRLFGAVRSLAAQRIAGLLLAAALVACGGGDEASGYPEGTVEFGPVSADVAFTLTGTVRYEDRLLDGSGFTGATAYKPVRYGVVELVNAESAVIESGYTDQTGRFALSTTAGGLLRLRVLARTASATGIRIDIKNSAGELYAVSRYFVPADGELDLGNTDIAIGSMAGAWNILDVFTAGAEFVAFYAGSYPATTLTAYWQPGSTGTYFSNNAIRIIGGTALGEGDTDEYDDDVLWHEYGHYIESMNGFLDSKGGPHALGDNTQDLRLAWSEGWASFISGTIKKRLKESGSPTLSDTANIDSLYVDTFNTGTRLIWLFDRDYVPGSDRELNTRYASNEGAVAKVLWGLSKDFTFAGVWDGFRNFVGRTRPASLETHWDYWRDTADVAVAFGRYHERYAGYQTDAQEPNDAMATASSFCSSSGPYALYRNTGTDTDHFRVTLNAGTTYTIETFELTNGADTALAILDSSGTALVYNDNASGASYVGTSTSLNVNDGITLASRVVFNPDITGDYYIRVTPAGASLAAGDYGNYNLRVSPAACP